MVSVLSACVFFSPFPTIHSLGSKASSQSLLRRKRFSVVSRITNKCLLESVTVTQLLKQFPISNADGHISGPRSSFLTGLSVCTSTQCALQHIKISASCVWVTPLQPVVGQAQSGRLSRTFRISTDLVRGRRACDSKTYICRPCIFWLPQRCRCARRCIFRPRGQPCAWQAHHRAEWRAALPWALRCAQV